MRAHSEPQACDPDAEAGEWLTRLDLVPRGKRLAVEAQEGPGKCGSTCRTLARACEEALGDWDTDVAEALFRNDSPSPRAWLEGLLCRELSGACAKPAPPLAAGRPPSPPFEPKSEQDLEMEKMMRGLADVPGMPGMSLYSRDDLAGMVGETGAELEEELDDEEEPPPPPKPAQPKPKPELKPKPKPKPAPKAKAAKPSGQSGGEAARAAARRAAKAAEAARERLSGAIGGALDRAGRVAQAGAARFERGVEWTAEQVSRGYSWAEERLKKKEDL